MLLGGSFSLAIFLLRNGDRAYCLLIELRLSAFVSLPHCAVGWSAVCDCGISWSYSLAFYARNFEKVEGAYCFGVVRVCACVCEGQDGGSGIH